MPSPDVLRALLAGLIAGSATAFGCTTILLVMLWRDRRWLARAPRLRVPLPLVGVVATNGFLLGWTALGMLLGAGLHRVEAARPMGGLGSPNLAFTLVVLAAAGGALGTATFVRGRLTWPAAAMAATATLSFGWLLPWLGA